jgi:hypothetical protein
MRTLLIMLLMSLFPVQAQQAKPHAQPAGNAELQQLFRMRQARACTYTEGVCADVCEAADSLESAAQDLLSCARKRDFDNDCHRQVRDVRDAGDQYESAIAESSGECS